MVIEIEEAGFIWETEAAPRIGFTAAAYPRYERLFAQEEIKTR